MDALSLDEAREQFYVGQRANERFAQNLKQIVDELESTGPEGAWLALVEEEAARAARYHAQQAEQWSMFSNAASSYVASVKKLADKLAIAELKGGPSEEVCVRVSCG